MANRAKITFDLVSLTPEVTGSCLKLKYNIPNEKPIQILLDKGYYQEAKYSSLNIQKDVDLVILIMYFYLIIISIILVFYQFYIKMDISIKYIVLIRLQKYFLLHLTIPCKLWKLNLSYSR